jgi:hypothetical protein
MWSRIDVWDYKGLKPLAEINDRDAAKVSARGFNPLPNRAMCRGFQ